MEAIVNYNGVYLFVKDNSSEFSENLPEGAIVVDNNSAEKQLFGGRIRLSRLNRTGARLYVDGIIIKVINFDDSDGKILFEEVLPTDSVCSFLNQIEMLGVDTFLENYKQSLLDAKEKYEDLARKIEANISISPNDSELKRRLRFINEFLGEMICIIFMLAINMNAGMDNHMYSNAFSEFVNLYVK